MATSTCRTSSSTSARISTSIDFSETRPRNAVSDFARIEPILKFEFPRLQTDEDLRALLEFEAGLTRVKRLSDPPPFEYRGDDPLVARAHAVITLLRRCGRCRYALRAGHDSVLAGGARMDYSVLCYVQIGPRAKRYALCSAALICRAIQELEGAR